jgi:LuxR family transcriptional regulator, maltose regulon positive regulatory protein
MVEDRPAFPSIKLHRPRSVAGWIARPRLLERLDQVLHEPVALISAPAGFGKTTLLSQWLDRCPLPNAWLQLDEGDHELPAFLTGVVAALRQIFPDCLRKTGDLLLLSHGSIPLTIWKSTLIEDLKLLEDTPFVLALEDYHLVGNPSVDLLLADVLLREVLSLHLIISARRSPSLSFSKLRVQRRIVEIPTADLRFTDTEAALYFDQAAHIALSDSAIHQLQSRTEGWAAGLVLAAISLREEVQPEDLISHLSDSDSQVSDYLLDQVFNNQPREIQEFLLKTATFNQFCAPMLREAFGFEQSEGEIQGLLERIESTQLFLISLNAERTCFRYHHLFRQMLLSRQRLYLPTDQIELFHRRAAAWLIRQGQTDEALEHLLAVREWTGAAQLVEGQLCTLLNAEDFHAIKQRLGYFSEDFIATRPGLLLMQAWMAHFALRMPVLTSLTIKIQALLDAASKQKETAEGGSPPPGFEILSPQVVQAHVWMLDSIRYCLTNQGGEAIPLAWQALEILPETWQFARGNAMLYLGLGMLMEGQYQQAVELLTYAFERQHDPGSTYRVRLLNNLTILHMLHGELELARQTVEQMLRDALTYNLVLMQGWGYYLLGRVYLEWNQLDLAARHFKQVVDQRFTSNLMPSLEAISGYIDILHLLGRGGQAQQFLDSLEQLHGELSVTPPMLQSLLAWLKLQAGSRDEARRWAESFNIPVAGQSTFWLYLPHMYKARILMDLGEPEASPVAGQLLAEIEELAERTHITSALVRVLVLRAVWLSRQDDCTAARQALERALRLARPGWFIHAFVKQGPEILELLQEISPSLDNEPGLLEYVTAIIAEFSVPLDAHPTSPRQTDFRTLLTEREFEVLELLAERLSINEISARLYISPSTVQQHTHHLYRKLNVANKRQAVATAEMLGILTPKR